MRRGTFSRSNSQMNWPTTVSTSLFAGLLRRSWGPTLEQQLPPSKDRLDKEVLRALSPTQLRSSSTLRLADIANWLLPGVPWVSYFVSAECCSTVRQGL